MFYCNPCGEKKNWPTGTEPASYGPCEICSNKTRCNDIPSSQLPVSVDQHGLRRDKMKKVCIAFDIDGTLRNNINDMMVPNERIRTLLIILSSFKNTWIHVWTGGGELYAAQAIKALSLDQYVDSYGSKTDGYPKSFTRETTVAIDDIQECDMGILNLIVREK